MQGIKSYVKVMKADRQMLGVLIGLGVFAVILLVLALILLPTSDHQIVTQYTIFGESHFYRARWWYLVSFMVSIVAAVVLHSLLGLRAVQLGNAVLGRTIAYAGYAVLVVAAVVMWKLFRLES